MFTIPPFTPSPGGFIDSGNTPGERGSRLMSGWLNYVSTAFPRVLDAIQGGYYQFVGDIRLSSDIKQVKINAPDSGHKTELRGFVKIALSDDANYVTGTGTLTVDVPATFSAGVTMSGALTFSSTVQFDGAVTVNAATTFTSNGDITWQSGCVVTGSSGSSLTMNSGSTTTINGSATLAGTNTLSGATTANNTATFNGTTSFTKGFTATQSVANTDAITVTGNGTGKALDATGGVSARALIARNGTPQTNTNPTCAAEFVGYIKLSGTDPNFAVDPGDDNVLHAGNIAKASCTVQVGTGGPYTPAASYNIDSVIDVIPGVYRIRYARSMATVNYTPIVTCNETAVDVRSFNQTQLYVEVAVIDPATRALVGTAATLNLLVHGSQ